MKKHLIVIGTAVLLLVVGLSGCITNDNTTNDDINLDYENIEYGIGFNPPENWTIFSSPDTDYTSIITYDYNQEAILAISKPTGIEEGKSFYEAMDSEMDGYHILLYNFSLIYSNEIIINGMNAYEIVFTYEQNVTVDSTIYYVIVQEKHVFIEKGGIVYLLGYSATPENYDLYIGVVNQSIQTFTII